MFAEELNLIWIPNFLSRANYYFPQDWRSVSVVVVWSRFDKTGWGVIESSNVLVLTIKDLRLEFCRVVLLMA